jgi:diguanylate cyclase (GGDEF)-like protein
VITDCASRSADLAARYGGEEFACILPETDHDGAIVIAEKIRRGIIARAIPHKGSNVSSYVTASLGVVTVRYTVEISAVDIVAQVDDALYRAKSYGRNRVEFGVTQESQLFIQPGNRVPLSPIGVTNCELHPTR